MDSQPRLSELESALVGAHNAGDEAGARVLAQAIREKRTSLGMNPDTGTYDVPNPADVGNTFVEGIGKGMHDVWQGIRQVFPGGPTHADVAEQRRLDAPLMNTTGGKLGNITGTIAATAPAAFIPGANTMAGSAAIGAGLGYLQPSASTEETAMNTALGGVVAPAALATGRGIAAAYRGGKAILEPLFAGGREKIAARTLQAFAGGPEAAAKVAQDLAAGGGKAFTPGVVRTLAESTDNAGISQLQRVLENQPELITRFGQLARDNKAAIVEAVDAMSDTGKKAFFEAMRETTAQQMYRKAWSAGFNEKAVQQLAPNIAELMQRPSIQAAIPIAKRIAAEEGEQLADVGSMKGLHYVKKALDDSLDNAAQTGIGNVQRHAIAGTRSELLAIMDKVSKGGAYPKARAEFEALSKPINQIDVVQALREKLIPAIADFGDNTKLLANSFANALRHGDTVAQKATGFGGATMEKVLDPAQLEVLRGVAKDLAAKTAAQGRAAVVGSNTGRNLVAQNFMRQMLGPLGLPQSTLERAAGSGLTEAVLGRPAQWLGKYAEPRIMETLADAMVNPDLAQRLLTTGAGNARPGIMANGQALLLPIERGLMANFSE